MLPASLFAQIVFGRPDLVAKEPGGFETGGNGENGDSANGTFFAFVFFCSNRSSCPSLVCRRSLSPLLSPVQNLVAAMSRCALCPMTLARDSAGEMARDSGK